MSLRSQTTDSWALIKLIIGKRHFESKNIAHKKVLQKRPEFKFRILVLLKVSNNKDQIDIHTILE